MAGTSYFKNKYPRFLLVLVFTELWERFSYYSMRSILVLYMTSQMHLSDTFAIGVYSLLSSIGYILPIFAGIVADRFFGFRIMIFIGGFTIILGHILLIFSQFSNLFFFWGIGAVATGTGFFKGNITNLLGSSFDAKPHLDRLSGFTLFYSGINLGAFISSFTSGYSSVYIGYHFAFSLAGVGMAFGLIIFSFNSKLYYDLDIIKDRNFLTKKFFGFLDWIKVLAIAALIITIPVSVLFYFADEIAKINFVLYLGIIVFIALIAYTFFIKDTREKKNYIILLIYFIFLMIFFSFELQLGSLFTLFIERHAYKYLGPLYIPAAVSSSFNPGLIMTVGFILSNFKNTNTKYDALRIAIGVASNTFCFLILYWGATEADPETYLTSLAYPFFGILTMASGEVLMAPLIQSATTKYAPNGSRGLMMGIYMGMLGFASLTGFIFEDIFAVPMDENGEINLAISIEIYKEGFLMVSLYNLIFVVLVILAIPLLYWLRKPSKTEIQEQNNQKLNYTVETAA